uniref:Dynein axonemal heavy chain 17 n=1 Tax=Rousettus aegyptiacus TaxID=9407 RepID=A0A7J8G7N9_ROUAE|nr:dynein axonemal heavy chain 17 [Rousettus aegyptiacus]
MTITPDVRLEYLEGVASIMLKFKPDKWGKMLSVEEHLAWLMDFLEKPDVLVLVLTLSPAGTIVPCLGFPASLKTKALLDGLQPLPRVEFEFWDARLQNLKCIHDQLNRPKVNKIVEILEKAKSCYWPALQNVYLNVTEGLKEANDIVLYLMPLRILLEEMEQADFTMLPTFIAKVLYTICFIWATSEHYNTPSRVIVTLQEFCNQLIEMTRTYLSPEEVLKGLQGEIEEVLNNISLSVNILRELYRAYDFCCVNMELFFKKDKEPVPWEFPSSLAFSRMNAFFRRVRTVEDLYKTAIEFLKLEKIEVGGARGNTLGSLVTRIYEEVFELVKVFADCKYDPLDPGDPSFDDDYADFETKIQDLDRRLATIFCQAFDDCNSIESCAKLPFQRPETKKKKKERK